MFFTDETFDSELMSLMVFVHSMQVLLKCHLQYTQQEGLQLFPISIV